MLPDWVSNPGPLTYESGALSIGLRGLSVERNSEDHRRFDPYALQQVTWCCLADGWMDDLPFYIFFNRVSVI